MAPERDARKCCPGIVLPHKIKPGAAEETQSGKLIFSWKKADDKREFKLPEGRKRQENRALWKKMLNCSSRLLHFSIVLPIRN